jgi:isopenicillin-N epimerase
VTSPTALIFPLEQLIALAHRHGILVVVDGAHGPAFLDLALADSKVDYYTGNCHKWMCAPKGAGFLYVRSDHQASIASPIISWGQVANVDGGPSPVDGFTGSSALERELQWLGTRDPSAALSVPAAIDFMQRHDWRKRRQLCRDLAQEVGRELAHQIGGRSVLTHRIEAQMVAVALPKCDGEVVRERLYQEHGIEMPVTRHAGQPYARVSVQVYNTEAELQRLVEVLPPLVREVAAASA